MKQATVEKKWKVTIFEWGSFALDGGGMFGSVPKTLWSKLSPSDAENRIPLALRSLLLEKDNMKVLVDLGMGGDWPEKQKKIYKLETHAAEEILSTQTKAKPSDITHVVLTHLHFDHCGFLSQQKGKEKISTFANAEIIVTEKNWQNAHSPSPREAASYIEEIWAPARKQFRLVACEWLEWREILPGIHFRRVDGHTPGQAIVYVDSEKGPHIFLADLCPTENHIKSTYVMGYDVRAALSVREKEIILRESTTLESTLVFEHSPTLRSGSVEILDSGQIALTKS